MKSAPGLLDCPAEGPFFGKTFREVPSPSVPAKREPRIPDRAASRQKT